MNALARVPFVTNRWRRFLAAQEPGHLLVAITIPCSEPPVRPLTAFEFDRQLGEYLDERLDAARSRWEAKAGIDDDTLPAFTPSFGIAEHSAWLGLEVRDQEWTNWPLPCVHTADDISRLQPNPATPWFRRMHDAYAHCRQRQDGSFFLAVRGAMMPMDLANAVRGDAFLLDLLDAPAFAHALLKRLTELLPWYYRHLLSWSDTIAGGHLFFDGKVWAPDPTIGPVSNDAALLCGPQIYSAFGFPYEQSLLASYRYGIYHVHNQNLGHLPTLATLPNLGLIQMQQDPKTPPPIDNLQEIFAATGHVALMIRATSEQVRRHLKALCERNVLLDVVCHDRADAEDILRLVRDRSKPYS